MHFSWLSLKTICRENRKWIIEKPKLPARVWCSGLAGRLGWAATMSLHNIKWQAMVTPSFIGTLNIYPPFSRDFINNRLWSATDCGQWTVSRADSSASLLLGCWVADVLLKQFFFASTLSSVEHINFVWRFLVGCCVSVGKHCSTYGANFTLKINLL